VSSLGLTSCFVGEVVLGVGVEVGAGIEAEFVGGTALGAGVEVELEVGEVGVLSAPVDFGNVCEGDGVGGGGA